MTDGNLEYCSTPLTEPSGLDVLVGRISHAMRSHRDATVVTGRGGERRLFPPEIDRLARIAGEAAMGGCRGE